LTGHFFQNNFLPKIIRKSIKLMFLVRNWREFFLFMSSSFAQSMMENIL
jgi:hypothetical protein